jgi:integrase
MSIKTVAAWKGAARNRSPDALPARANMLRHTFLTVAADLGVDDLLINFLMGHCPEGISQKYSATRIFANDPELGEVQARMSKRMVELFRLNAKAFREEIAAALAVSLQTGRRGAGAR